VGGGFSRPREDGHAGARLPPRVVRSGLALRLTGKPDRASPAARYSTGPSAAHL
jgi:hypothetical protein